MKENVEQDCPLCGTAAAYYFVSSGQRKYFDCPECTLFQVSKSAERYLLVAPQHVRQSFAARVKLTPEDHLFVILRPPLHEADPADGKIVGSFTPVEKLDR